MATPIPVPHFHRGPRPGTGPQIPRILLRPAVIRAIRFRSIPQRSSKDSEGSSRPVRPLWVRGDRCFGSRPAQRGERFEQGPAPRIRMDAQWKRPDGARFG